MNRSDYFHSKWLLGLKDSLTVSGNLNLWASQQNIPLGLGKIVKLRLIDRYKQEWSEQNFLSSKCLNYRIFKTELVPEQYFKLLPKDLVTAFCHFRCLNHKLPIVVFFLYFSFSLHF